MQYDFEIITCDPSVYCPDLTDLNFMQNSIGPKKG